MVDDVQSLRLGEQARKRGILVIYANTFLMYGGFFMVIPLISIHYQSLGWSTATVGAVLAVRQLVQQGLSLIGGIVADQVGARPPIVAGLFVRAAGFAWMAFADSPPTLFASAILAALGGSLFEAPKSAAGAALTSPPERPAFYRTLGIVGNTGMAVGPALGALLLRFEFGVVALAAAAIFVVAAVLAATLLPHVRVASAASGALFAGTLMALRDRRFVTFTLLVMGYWFLAVQYYITLPLMVKAVGGSDGAVGLVLTIYSVVTIVLQYPLLRLLEGRVSIFSTMVAGMAIMAVGLGAVAFVGALWPLVACTVVYAVGNLLAQPPLQTVTARLVNPIALGSYFAIGAYALAIGGGLGNISGGALFEVATASDRLALPWLTFGAVGVITAVGFVWFGRRWYPADVDLLPETVPATVAHVPLGPGTVNIPSGEAAGARTVSDFVRNQPGHTKGGAVGRAGPIVDD